MPKQQQNQNPAAENPEERKHSPASPRPGSPMEKFNNALRKILSVPKNDIKKK